MIRSSKTIGGVNRVPNTDQIISCPLCGQTFPWKQEYAGRKLACACGNTIELSAPPEPEIYDLRDAPPPAAVPVLPLDDPPPGKLTLDTSGQEIPDAKPAKVLSYRRISSPEHLKLDDDACSRWRDLWVPIGMLTFSAVMLIGLVIIMSHGYQFSTSAIASHLSMRIVWDIAMMLLAGMVIQWTIDTGLGEFNIAILKLVALALFRFSLSAIVQPDGNIALAMLGFLLTFPMLVYLFGYLFEFDFTESLFCAVITSAMRLISYFGLWRIL